MDDIYKNIEEYNSNKKRKILIMFDDMIADMFSNKKLDRIATEFITEEENLSCFYRTILSTCPKKY